MESEMLFQSIDAIRSELANLFKCFSDIAPSKNSEVSNLIYRLYGLETDLGLLKDRISNEFQHHQTPEFRPSQHIIDFIPDGYVVTDRAGKIIEANACFREMAHEEQADLIGCPLSDYIDPRNRECLQNLMNDLAEVGKNLVYDVKLAMNVSTESLIAVSVSAEGIVDENGEVNRIQWLFRDITEQKKLENEKRRYERGKTESLASLASGIAHDFNNLLTGIMGYTSLALIEESTTGVARESLTEIGMAAQRAAELTRQMLVYSGRARFNIHPLDLNQFVGSAEKEIALIIPWNCNISYHLAKIPVTIEADESQLLDALKALATNACEAIGEGSGKIEIQTGIFHADSDYLEHLTVNHDLTEGNYAFLEVKDTGRGIDDAAMERMFEPFFTTKFQGKGLGLSSVLGIIHGHRGGVLVTSALGQGATFRLLFSIVPAAVEKAAAIPFGVGEESGRTVLVVDDEELILTLSKRSLRRAGVNVFTAINGGEALEIYKSNLGKIDLVVLDLTMPVLDGFETYELLHEIDPQVHVLLSSGYDQEVVYERFMGKTLEGFLQKPYSPAKLQETVLECLERLRHARV